MRTHISSFNGSVSMVNLLVWHLLPPVWWGLPWRCSALTVCICVCVCVSVRVVYMTFIKCCVSDMFLCEASFESMCVWPDICVSGSLYFGVFLCVCSLHVLVGPVQGAPSVWAHVWPAVGRPPGRFWQREDPGVLWAQHSQRLLLFLQVQDTS